MDCCQSNQEMHIYIYIYIYARANPCPLCTAFRAQCNMSLVRNALTYTCSASIHNKMTKFFMLAIRLVKIVMLERERERFVNFDIYFLYPKFSSLSSI